MNLYFVSEEVSSWSTVALRGVRRDTEAAQQFSQLSNCVRIMVRVRSKSKLIRDKRRLLSFIIRKRCQGENVNLDYWQMCVELRNIISINETEIDLQKHPEQRLVCLVGTVQKSLSTKVREEKFVRDLVETKIRCSRIATGQLSSNPMFNGNGSEFTYIFNVNIILESNVTHPSDYIWTTLVRDSFEYDRGKRIFLKLGQLITE